MAGAPAEGREQVFPRFGRRRTRKRRIAWRHLRAANKLRKVIDVGETESVWHVLRIGRDLSNRNGLHPSVPPPRAPALRWPHRESCRR